MGVYVGGSFQYVYISSKSVQAQTLDQDYFKLYKTLVQKIVQVQNQLKIQIDTLKKKLNQKAKTTQTFGIFSQKKS